MISHICSVLTLPWFSLKVLPDRVLFYYFKLQRKIFHNNNNNIRLHYLAHCPYFYECFKILFLFHFYLNFTQWLPFMYLIFNDKIRINNFDAQLIFVMQNIYVDNNNFNNNICIGVYGILYFASGFIIY